MDVSVRLDHPDAKFTNGDIVHGEIIIYCPGLTTISKITSTLSGDSSSFLSSPPGLWVRRKHEERHRVVQHTLEIVPKPSSLDDSRDELTKLSFGYHSFPFDLQVQDTLFSILLPDPNSTAQIPWFSKCVSCPSNLLSSAGDFDGQRSSSERGGNELPPSMGKVPKEADVSYRIDVSVTILRNMFKTTLRKRTDITVWPIDTRSRSAFNLPTSGLTSSSSVQASIPGPHPSLGTTGLPSNASAPITTCMDPAQIMISASFLPDFSLTCGREVPMHIIVTKLNGYRCDMYLQSFQMLLVGYTDIRAGTVTHGRMGFWMIQSLSNLGARIGEADDDVGMVNTIDPRLWRGKTLPESVIPSFKSCNIEQRYELEILLGFQRRSPKSRVLCVQLRIPVRVFSGIRPGRRLSVAAKSSFEVSCSFEDTITGNPGISNGMNHVNSDLDEQVIDRKPFANQYPPATPPTYEEAIVASKAENLRRQQMFPDGRW